MRGGLKIKVGHCWLASDVPIILHYCLLSCLLWYLEFVFNCLFIYILNLCMGHPGCLLPRLFVFIIIIIIVRILQRVCLSLHFHSVFSCTHPMNCKRGRLLYVNVSNVGVAQTQQIIDLERTRIERVRETATSLKLFHMQIGKQTRLCFD